MAVAGKDESGECESYSMVMSCCWQCCDPPTCVECDVTLLMLLLSLFLCFHHVLLLHF